MDHEKKSSAEDTFNLILEKVRLISSSFLMILLLALVVLLGASITMRYFLGQPISWSNSIARYIYIYIVLIGSAVSYMLGGHATIESFYNIAPKPVQKVFDLIHYIVVMGLCSILVINGSKYAVSMWGVNSPVLMNLPMGVVYLSVPIGFAIIFLFLLKKIFFWGGRKK